MQRRAKQLPTQTPLRKPARSNQLTKKRKEKRREEEDVTVDVVEHSQESEEVTLIYISCNCSDSS